ncbi:MAG: cytochrome c biogenesis CcdA family protein [Fervidobacterium sp.]
MVSLKPTDVSLWIAFGTGLLSFFSPCVLPLIPGFVGIVIGGGKDTKNRLQRLIGFFIGFSLMFTTLGAFSGIIGSILTLFSGIIEKIIGFSIIIFAVLFAFDVQLFKGRNVNIWKFKGSGFFGGILLGLGVGFVWIPCSSPILASILLIATQESVFKGMTLLFLYSLGISIPFLTIGTFISKVLTKSIGKPRWEKWTKIIGAILIALLGILIILGKMKV